MTEPQPAALGPLDSTIAQIDRLKALDAAAWQELFDGYFHKMRSFAYARTGDAALAEDIASEVFAAAVRGIGRYQATGAPIGAWLYRIARNLTADQVERRVKRPQTSIEEMEIEVASSTPQLEDRADLAQGLTRLTRDQQELIALRFFSDCTLEETALAMHKSVGAVKVLQHRALAALRRQLTSKDAS